MLDLSKKNNVLLQTTGSFSDIKEVISEMRDEIGEHLEAINENTNEIQSNFQYIGELDSKIDKLNERIDQIQLFLANYGFAVEEKQSLNIAPLTKKEEEVFLVLYTLDNEKGTVTYADISRRTGLPETLVMSYILSMAEKGVPIIRRCIKNKPYLSLEPRFKRLQAKENILKIAQTTIRNL